VVIQFRKLIIISILFSFSNACCCINQINNATNDIKNYIKTENLYIANKYLKDYDKNLSEIKKNIYISNLNLKKIVNVKYSLSKEDGIILRMNKQNFLLKKQIDLESY